MLKDENIGRKYRENGFQEEDLNDSNEENGVTIIIHETPGSVTLSIFMFTNFLFIIFFVGGLFYLTFQINSIKIKKMVNYLSCIERKGGLKDLHCIEQNAALFFFSTIESLLVFLF